MMQKLAPPDQAAMRATPSGRLLLYVAQCTMIRVLQTRSPIGVRCASTARKRASDATPRRNNKRIQAAITNTDLAAFIERHLTESASNLRVLGLDINTNSTGYAVLRGDGRVASWGHVDTANVKSSDILTIAHSITRALDGVHGNATDNMEWLVGIEDFMRMYRFGKFHNKGIFQLAQLNGIVSYTCWQRFGCRPVHTHPTAARGFFKIATGNGTKKGGAISVKDQVMDFVVAQEGVASAAVQQLRHDHTSCSGQWTDAAFDIADAYVVARFTRWAAAQEAATRDAELVSQFVRAYTANVADVTKKRQPSAEDSALQTMTPARRHAYFQELFAHGVSEWLRHPSHEPTLTDTS